MWRYTSERKSVKQKKSIFTEKKEKTNFFFFLLNLREKWEHYIQMGRRLPPNTAIVISETQQAQRREREKTGKRRR